jgi:SAM-dependent methyltransferase
MQPLPSIEPGLETIPNLKGDYAERVPLAAAAAAQGMAIMTVLLLMAIVPGEAARSIHPLSWALLQGAAAAVIGSRLRMEAWWIPIHALFVPGLVWTLALQPPPEFALTLFCLLASVYWGVSRSRVPLFLSSPAAAQAVADLLPRDRDFSFLDLGCGLGGVLSHLARTRPLGRYHGVELAPVPFLLGRLRAALIGRNCRVSWQDFRTLDFGGYEVIYAYLSPAAMDGLWEKASREMRPGSLLISNSFSVPGVQPAYSLPAGTGVGSRLLVWRM